MADVEYGEVKDFEFNDQTRPDIRRRFIRKVYFILMCQLLVTFGFIYLFAYYQPIRWWVLAKSYVMFVALAVTFVTMVVMVCCDNVRRRTPMNFIFLYIFTITESFLLGVVATTSAPDAVMMAVGVTAAVSLALTLFSFQTRWDFTVMGGFLVCALVILLIFGIRSIFIRNNILQLVYPCVGSLIFCLYLVYDTQLMMGGRHKYRISTNEYVFAALNLYLDIVNIFFYIIILIFCFCPRLRSRGSHYKYQQPGLLNFQDTPKFQEK